MYHLQTYKFKRYIKKTKVEKFIESIHNQSQYRWDNDDSYVLYAYNICLMVRVGLGQNFSPPPSLYLQNVTMKSFIIHFCVRNISLETQLTLWNTASQFLSYTIGISMSKMYSDDILGRRICNTVIQDDKENVLSLCLIV